MFNVRNIEDIPQILKDNLRNIKTVEVTINTLDSLGMITSKDIKAVETVPSFNKSTVDGYACKYEDVKLASSSSPTMLKIVGEVEMGKEVNIILKDGEAVYVPTGGMVPKGADAMVMIENTDVLKNNVLINRKSTSFENILKIGDDIKMGEVLINKNTLISPRTIGVLMSQNITSLSVYDKVTCSIISTGDEIIKESQEITLGQVRDINSYTVKNYLNKYNVEVNSSNIIPDNFEEYKQAILNGFKESKLVISSGGSSVGEKDYTIKILEDIGANIFLHGLNVKPGKPTILATFEDNVFIGLPGHPFSAYVVLDLLFDLIMNQLFSIDQIKIKPYIEAKLTTNIHNNSGRTLIQLVEIIQEKELSCTPIFSRSAMIKSLNKAYGYVKLDRNSEGVYKDEIIKVYRFGD